MTTDALQRYPPEVEAAVYFCCLEAMQNIAKYSGAASARINVAAENGDLRFEVTDDGKGFRSSHDRLWHWRSGDDRPR